MHYTSRNYEARSAPMTSTLRVKVPKDSDLSSVIRHEPLAPAKNARLIHHFYKAARETIELVDVRAPVVRRVAASVGQGRVVENDAILQRAIGGEALVVVLIQSNGVAEVGVVVARRHRHADVGARGVASGARIIIGALKDRGADHCNQRDEQHRAQHRRTICNQTTTAQFSSRSRRRLPVVQRAMDEPMRAAGNQHDDDDDLELDPEDLKGALPSSHLR